jgi:hypothetical protein
MRLFFLSSKPSPKPIFDYFLIFEACLEEVASTTVVLTTYSEVMVNKKKTKKKADLNGRYSPKTAVRLACG